MSISKKPDKKKRSMDYKEVSISCAPLGSEYVRQSCPRFRTIIQNVMNSKNCAEMRKSKKKALELINKRKVSHDALDLEMRNKRNYEKNLRPNRFHDLVKSNLGTFKKNSEGSNLHTETSLKEKEVKTELKNNLHGQNNTVLVIRNINNNAMEDDASHHSKDIKSDTTLEVKASPEYAKPRDSCTNSSTTTISEKKANENKKQSFGDDNFGLKQFTTFDALKKKEPAASFCDWKNTDLFTKNLSWNISHKISINNGKDSVTKVTGMSKGFVYNTKINLNNVENYCWKNTDLFTKCLNENQFYNYSITDNFCETDQFHVNSGLLTQSKPNEEKINDSHGATNIDLFKTNNKFDSETDNLSQCENESKNNKIKTNFTRSKVQKDKGRLINKKKYFRSNSKVMDMIKIFAIGKLWNMNSNKKYPQVRRLKNKPRSGSLSIINLVKKYSPLFTVREKNMFLKNIASPTTKKKLNNRCSKGSQKKKSKLFESHSSTSAKEAKNSNDKNGERIQKLMNYRIRLNTCLQYYYNIRPGNNDDLVKVWDIFKNIKFNIFDKNLPYTTDKAGSSSKENSKNSKGRKKNLWNYNIRKGQPVNSKSSNLINDSLSSNSLLNIIGSSSISNESLRKFVRTNKINSELIMRRKSKLDKLSFSYHTVDPIKDKSSSTVSSSASNAMIHRKFLGSSNNQQYKNKKNCKFPLLNKTCTPRLLKMTSEDDPKYFHISTNKVYRKNTAEEATQSAVKNLPVVSITEMKMAELEERIKKSKAIVNPIKSTITDFVIETRKPKFINKTNLLRKHPVYVEQLYKNPNFRTISPEKERSGTDFIKKNKKFISSESKRVQEKLKDKKIEENLKKEADTSKPVVKVTWNNLNKPIKIENEPDINQKTYLNSLTSWSKTKSNEDKTEKDLSEWNWNRFQLVSESNLSTVEQKATRRDQGEYARLDISDYEKSNEDIFFDNKLNQFQDSIASSNTFIDTEIGSKTEIFDKNGNRTDDDCFSSIQDENSAIEIPDYEIGKSYTKFKAIKKFNSKEKKSVSPTIFPNKFTIDNDHMHKEKALNKNNVYSTNQVHSCSKGSVDVSTITNIPSNETEFDSRNDVACSSNKVGDQKRATQMKSPINKRNLGSTNLDEKAKIRNVDTNLILSKIEETCRRFQTLKENDTTGEQKNIFELKGNIIKKSDENFGLMDSMENREPGVFCPPLIAQMMDTTETEDENFHFETNPRQPLSKSWFVEYVNPSPKNRTPIKEKGWNNSPRLSNNVGGTWSNVTSFKRNADKNVWFDGTKERSESCSSDAKNKGSSDSMNSNDFFYPQPSDYYSSTPQWLISDVFNVCSRESINDDSLYKAWKSKKGKSNRKTRFQEYLRRTKNVLAPVKSDKLLLSKSKTMAQKSSIQLLPPLIEAALKRKNS